MDFGAIWDQIVEFFTNLWDTIVGWFEGIF